MNHLPLWGQLVKQKTYAFFFSILLAGLADFPVWGAGKQTPGTGERHTTEELEHRAAGAAVLVTTFIF